MIQNRKRIEWSNFWWENANKDCSRILLLGDSVTRGYRSSLNGIFENTGYVVDLCAFSASITDGMTDKMIDGFFSFQEYSYEYIGIQLGGQHGFTLQCSLREEDRHLYKMNFQRYALKLRNKCKNMFFISYTPTVINENLNMDNRKRNKELITRNEIVKEVADEMECLYIDIWDKLLHKKCQHVDGIHFDRKANLYIATCVAKEIILKMHIPVEKKSGILESNYQRMILKECIQNNSEHVYQCLSKHYKGLEQGVVIWGTGIWGKEVWRVFANCPFPLFVVDNNEEKWGETFFKAVVSSPEICSNFEGYIVITALNAEDEIEKQIRCELQNNKVKLLTIEMLQKTVQEEGIY